MKRKSWISIACGGLLLIVLATPAAAADGGDAARFTLLERVMGWIESWVPTGAPGPGPDRVAAASAKAPKSDGSDGTQPTASTFCEPCNNNGELSSVIDPDG